jgi:hypothetical protein
VIAFNEFLRQNGITDTIQATSETVSFENNNGKKFVYPLVDLERSLKAISRAGDKLDKLLDGDWDYEEAKYRAALGQVLNSERDWNAVASNLGSQTPNTVRCLELYAYFRLGKKPPSELRTPDILRAKNLAPIFADRTLAQQFRDWLEDAKKLSPKSIQSYIGALEGVLSRYAGRPLLEIASVDTLESVRAKALHNADAQALNERGNQMYSAAFNHYAEFLKERFGDAPVSVKVSAAKILSDFEKSLYEIGFRQPS